MTRKKAPKVLQSEYIQAAIEHGRALEAGNHKRANREHGKLMKIYDHLGQIGAQPILLELLGHPDASVRCWAAVQMFTHEPERCDQVLQAIVNGPPGALQITTEVVLGELRKGTLP
jgi:hypothetical protein